jgi:threonylcarbamoyladenosine tRNA methylthiotransferase MtaB
MAVPGGRVLKIGFRTFGCKLNQYETEALASSFRSQGFSVVAGDEDADAYVINTCTVTARADHKARAVIRGIAREHPGSLLVVTGCSAQLEAETLAGLADNIVVVPQSEKARLLDLPRVIGEKADTDERRRSIAASGKGPAVDPFAFTVKEYSFHTRAFLKVQDGCDSWCSYCRVPQARGSAVSLSPDEVVRRAAELESLGYREIVITGVNISAYLSGGVDLCRLLGLLLGGTARTRYRLSSLEPESISEELAALAREPRVCPHFHIPVQSGADTTLARMKRRYRAGRVQDAVSLLRASGREPFMAADIIVGFPGETDAEYGATRDLVESIGFAGLHIFPFSVRPGTAAARMKPAVPERVRYQRARELTAVGKAQAAHYAESCVGRDVEVLLEAAKGRVSTGVSENYLKLEVRGLPSEVQSGGRLVSARVARPGVASFSSFLG